MQTSLHAFVHFEDVSVDMASYVRRRIWQLVCMQTSLTAFVYLWVVSVEEGSYVLPPPPPDVQGGSQGTVILCPT